MPDQELVDRLQSAQELVESRKEEQNRIEARQEQFREELDAFRETLKEEGIEPSKLDGLIDKQKKKVEQKLTKLEEKLRVSSAGQTQETAPTKQG